MHIKRTDTSGAGDFLAWCGAHVNGFTRSYMTIDNAMRAIEHKRGAYPCINCLKAIHRVLAKELGEKS